MARWHHLLGVGMCLGILGGILGDIWYQSGTRPIIYVAEASELEPRVVLIGTMIDWTPDRIDKEIVNQAEKYGVSAEVMREVVNCESNGSTTIQSRHKRPDGTQEQSFGLVQIYLPAHPHVTKEQAQDPEFALKFLAKGLSQGQGGMWTCYKQLYN